jgi:hypothetical protein
MRALASRPAAPDPGGAHDVGGDDVAVVAKVLGGGA